MRLLALAALAVSAQASTITTTGPGFTIGPITFSNMQYVSTATGTLPLMHFTLIPDPVYPDPDYPGNVMVFLVGGIGLDATRTNESTSELVTADFTLQSGYQLQSIELIASMGDGGGVGTSENVALTNPCRVNASPNNQGGECIPGSPLLAGTLSAGLFMSSGCDSCFGHGFIGTVSLFLRVVPVPVPEPGTWALVGLGMALCGNLRITRRAAKSALTKMI